MIKRLRIYKMPNNWYQKIALFWVLFAVFSSCEKWSETAEVSHVSYLPEFEILEGEFQSYIVVDSAEYDDPGALAFENNESLNVYYSGSVDLTEVGVYIITYYATNSDGYTATAERIVAVTHEDVSETDLSGTYEGTIWDPLVEMKVIKIDEDGYYNCADIMGYDGADMAGKFVDLGDGELYLVHGEGDFGGYAASEGEYTLSTLSWTVGLQDEPYSDLSIEVVWWRVDE
jgi:hypothetical protein